MSLVKRVRYSVRKLFSSLVGTHKKEDEAILKLKHLVNDGYWISLDPGSNSSGYAYWYRDQLVSKGSIKAKKGGISKRLQEMTLAVGDKKPELAIVEKVRTSTGHVYLTWSVGALLAGLGTEHTIEVSTGAWKKAVAQDYVKSDENDAEAIGRYVLALVREAG